MRWNCKRSFFKNHRNCSLKSSTKEPLFITSKFHAQEASSSWDFWKITSCDFTLIFYSFLTQSNICFLKMCLIRSTIANLCPIMVHSNTLDFNECRSEEVMFLLTLSVSCHCISNISNTNCDYNLHLSARNQYQIKHALVFKTLTSFCPARNVFNVQRPRPDVCTNYQINWIYSDNSLCTFILWPQYTHQYERECPLYLNILSICCRTSLLSIDFLPWSTLLNVTVPSKISTSNP